MKKIIYWLFMLPLFALLNGCDDTDTIIFDDELPQFEIKANAILLEVIMPKGSAADDEYYIVGDFNGGADRNHLRCYTGTSIPYAKELFSQPSLSYGIGYRLLQ